MFVRFYKKIHHEFNEKVQEYINTDLDTHFILLIKIIIAFPKNKSNLIFIYF